MRPTTSEVPSPAADGFGAAHAATLAAAIPAARRLRSTRIFRSLVFSRRRRWRRFRGFGPARLIFFPTAKGEPIGVSADALGTPRRRSGRAVAVRRGHHPRAPTSARAVFAARERAQQVSPRSAPARLQVDLPRSREVSTSGGFFRTSLFSPTITFFLRSSFAALRFDSPVKPPTNERNTPSCTCVTPGPASVESARATLLALGGAAESRGGAAHGSCAGGGGGRRRSVRRASPPTEPPSSSP